MQVMPFMHVLMGFFFFFFFFSFVCICIDELCGIKKFEWFGI